MNISQTETKYNIDNAGAFYSGNDIFGNSKPILQLNQNDSITLPNTITFRDAVSAISYDNTAPGQAAVITYTYNDVVLGTASIDFTASGKRKQCVWGRDHRHNGWGRSYSSDAGSRTAPGLRSRQLPGKKIRPPAVRQ